MRIALFSECYSPVTNGVVTSLITLRQTLRSWGHTVYVFAPGVPQLDDDGDIFRLPELPFPRHPYHFARPFQRLSIDFAALDIEIIHCQHPFTVGRIGADMASRHSLPMVYTAHSLYDAMATYIKSSLARTMGERAARTLVRRFCARADYVIAPSRHTRDALRAAGVRSRFSIVPSGIIAPGVRPGVREEKRAELGLEADTPLLLYVGRLGPEKRVDILLRAVSMLDRTQLPEPASKFRLAIVGDGQCRAELESLVVALGIQHRVLFLGAQPHANIDAWYAVGDIFTLPSPMETQGLVLVEAMAAGLPCVAVDRGGAREVVLHGETGIRVPLEPQGFAYALSALLKDPDERERLGRNGPARAKAYSPEAMARGVLDVYQSVLRTPRSPIPVENVVRSPKLPIRRRVRPRREL